MRVLALRGENLASLAGPFELDLAGGALADTGLIAITGPTGAGKSTLLDAMCLALFDRTPRLAGRGSAVGFLHEEDQRTLSSGDPRCLLRRGATSGFAEVDFLGVRGERWRARWSVRRARGQALGRLQAQRVSLENLDTGISAGGTKTQTLAAIEEAIGLDYAGFCRSALLAQGEFAGFLRARPEERAALLERVTGTEIYGQLSIAAHKRASREREQVALLDARLEGFRRLPAAERASLRAALEEAERVAREAATTLTESESALAWHEQHVRLRASATAADAELEQARARWLAAGAERQRLVAWEFAQPLVLLQRAAGRAAAVEADAERERALAQQALEAAQVAQEAACGVALASGQVASEAELRLRREGPKLRQAAALERALEERGSEAARARLGAGAAEGVLATAQSASLAAEAAASEARLERQGALAELAADPLGALLAQERTSWDARLARLRRAATDRPLLAASAEVAAAECGRLALEATRRTEVANAASQAAQTAGLAYRAQGEQAETWPPARAAWAERRVRLVELRAARETALAARAREDEARANGRTAEDEVAASETGAVEARAAELQAVSALAEAERALVFLERSLGLSDLRHELRDGHPCALCGAEEHPYASQLPPLDQALAGQRDRVVVLREQVRGARGDGRALAERRDQASVRAGQARSRAEAAAEAASEAEGRWLELAWKASWTLGRAAATLGPDAPAETLSTELDEAFAEAEARLTELARLTQEREEAGQALSTLSAERAAAREAELEAGQAHRDSAAASRQAAEFVEHLGAKVARGLDELAEPFDQVRSEQEASEQEASEQEATKQGEDWRAGDWRAGDWRAGDWRAGDWRAGDWRAGDWRAGDWRAGDWRAGFAQDPTAFIADLSKRSAAAADARSRQESARAELERFEPRAAATQAEATAAERALAAAEELCEVADRLREAAQVEVTGLGLGPETLPSQLLASLEDESARSQEDRVTAERERARAESTRAAAEALAAQVVAAQELARVAHQARREELGLERDQALLSLAKRLGDEERAQRGGAPDPEGNTSEERSLDLIALLRAVEAWTPAAATAARAAGEVLREALRSAEHDLRLRREALRGHEASGTPSFSAPEARAAVDAAGPRRATADEARSRIRGVLLADEAAKQEAEELSQRLETQRLGADRWQALGALIGSHDGKRLRVFAQSLTLELLLDQANLALADLAPRYRLARVTGQDLDLQVIDTTLGDEVRATSSLSGGESFLVSLALALGVGALSSQETSVESLFVDEGFGSLDTDAQELALSALDALQAGGRQVVLISHLPGLAERIGFGVRVVPQGRGRSRLEVGSLLATV